VLGIFWRILKLIERKLFEDVIFRADIFDKRTCPGDRKVKEVKGSQCEVIKVKDTREHINAIHERIEVRVQRIHER
jgi:hypothetical protein